MAKTKQIIPKIDRREIKDEYKGKFIYSSVMNKNILIMDAVSKYPLYDILDMGYIFKETKEEINDTTEE